MGCPSRARRRAWLLRYWAIGHVVELNRAAARVGMDGGAGRHRIGQAKIVGRRHAFKEQKMSEKCSFILDKICTAQPLTYS